MLVELQALYCSLAQKEWHCKPVKLFVRRLLLFWLCMSISQKCAFTSHEFKNCFVSTRLFSW